jgi:hypothetical protein
VEALSSMATKGASSAAIEGGLVNLAIAGGVHDCFTMWPGVCSVVNTVCATAVTGEGGDWGLVVLSEVSSHAH